MEESRRYFDGADCSIARADYAQPVLTILVPYNVRTRQMAAGDSVLTSTPDRENLGVVQRRTEDRGDEQVVGLPIEMLNSISARARRRSHEMLNRSH